MKQTQVWYLENLVSEQELNLDPDRFHSVLHFPKLKTKHQLGSFLRLVVYCWNWIPNFSLMTKPLYVFFFFFDVDHFKIYLFIHFWLCWVFISVRGLSLVAVSGGHSSLWCASLSLSSWPLLFRSTGSRRAGSVTVVHGPSCSAACGIFPDQGSNPCPLRWQADSQPMRHRGSPTSVCFTKE